MNDKISWLNHEFSICHHDANWSNTAGIYIFCGIDQQKNLWIPLYIGQTENFRNRLPLHEQWNHARKLGATHVHAKAVSQQSQRDILEKQLIQLFQPKLNIQLK
ncbi:MAG: GIY-YIG nuclease family protein [Methylobacter sp.]|jgi:excinuclease UvrABC nuclease subunit